MDPFREVNGMGVDAAAPWKLSGSQGRAGPWDCQGPRGPTWSGTALRGVGNGRCWTRTSDPYDVNVVLYQLS